MRSKTRALVVAASLLTLGTVWLGSPPEAAAGPAISSSKVTLDLSETACVRKARQSVGKLEKIDRTIRTKVDDDTVWLANSSFTGMLLCIGIGDRSISLIVVASDSKNLSSAMKDNLRRGMK